MRIATILQGSDDDPSRAGAKRRRPREAQIHNSDLFQGAEIFGDKSPADEMMPSHELETLVFLKTLRHSCWCASLIAAILDHQSLSCSYDRFPLVLRHFAYYYFFFAEELNIKWIRIEEKVSLLFQGNNA